MNTFHRFLACLTALLLAVLPALAEVAPTAVPASDISSEEILDEDDSEFNEELNKKIEEILNPKETEEYQYYNSLLTYDDTPYAVTYDNKLLVYDGAKFQSLRFVQTDGVQTDEAYADSGIPFYSVILEGEDSLYALNRNNGLLYKIVLSGDTYSLSEYAQLNWEDMLVDDGDYTSARYIASGTVVNGMVYLLAQNDEYENDLYAFDIAKNTYENLSSAVPYATDVKAYRDGLALLSYEGLYYLNLQTDELSSMMSGYNGTGMAVDKEGHLYICVSNEIYSDRNTAGTMEVVGYTAVTNYYTDGPTAAIYGDYGYMRLTGSSDEDALELVDTAPGTMPEYVLRIANSNTDLTEAVKAFNQLYPGVPVVIDQSTYVSTAEDLSEAMQGSNPADLYGMSLNAISLSTLAKKDYLLALDDSMGDYAATLNERVREACSYNGTFYAVPTYTYAYTIGYNLKAFEKVGLTEDDVPKTYSEMLDFIDRWQNEFAEEYSEMSLFESMQWIDMKTQLLSSLLNYRELQCKVSGETLSFNDSALLETLEKFSQTDFYGFYDPNAESSDDDVYYEEYETDGTPRFLFTSYYSLQPQSYDNQKYMKPLVLTISEDDEPLVKSSLYVMVVNPETEHKEAALALLKCIAENIDETQKIAMMPDKNEPVINTWAIESLDNYERVISELTALKATLTNESDIKFVQEYLDNYTEMLNDYEQYRYAATAEDIANYRSVESWLVPAFVSTLVDSEVTTLSNRLRDGDINAKTFVNELTRKVQMILLEGD
jgi:hypothetical protein